LTEEQGPRVTPKRGRRIGDPFVRAVARVPLKVRTKLLIAFVGSALLLVTVGLFGQLVLGQSNDRVASVGPLQERAVQYSQLQAEAEHLRAVLSVNVAKEFNTIWPDVAPPQVEGTYSLLGDLIALDAAERFGAHTAPDQLLFTPPQEDQEILDSIDSKADRLSTLLSEEIIPLYGNELTISNEDKDLLDGMLPLRSQVEQLTRDLDHDAETLAEGTEAEVEELIARTESSFESSRSLFIGVASSALILALLLGFILS